MDSFAETAVSVLPHVNAALNTLATILLVAGFVLIKQRRESAHQAAMLGCFVVSALFLVCYLTYHALLPGHGKPFPTYPADWIRWGYYVVLITHIVLAAAVPFLAIWSIVLGLRNQRDAHRAVSWWTFPIWLYVSLTGVLVYLMLYHFFPPLPEA